MREHHKDASAQVARALLAGMSPDEQAEIQAEADLAGVSAVEIVRRSLDILISDSEVLARRNADVGTLPQ